ncbi:hypothetical protein RIVM261_062890 [Rivularia sp. IAM M-261]|nr:hypothetical protein CAL7716_049110 [Calothrix sp. PCC 7716]GJD21333.1 hypothetical protein RIVM261_062890 [Rivularia sp. IAM M-261]
MDTTNLTGIQTMEILDNLEITKADTIRVSALHALAYCPRLFYLEEVEELYAFHKFRPKHFIFVLNSVLVCILFLEEDVT